MKKIAKYFNVILILIFLISNATFAAEKISMNRTASVTKGTVRVDGSIDKAWNTATKIPVNVQVVDYNKKENLWADKSKSAKIEYCKLLWDNNFLYCLIKVNDKTPYNSPTGNGDSVEYHIAAKNDMGKYYKKIEDAQYRLGRDSKISGWGDFDRDTFKRYSKSVSTSTYYIQEIAIRWSVHGVSKAKAGMKLGFDIQVNDNADGKYRRFQLVWSSIDQAWTDPSSMGRLTLK